MSLETRRDHEKFLVGNISEAFPATQLATRREVLKYLLMKKHKAQRNNNNYSPVSSHLICCPLKSGSTEANCEGNDSCTQEDMCVVRCVKQAWMSAGFPTISDVSIRKQVEALDNKWKTINKHKSKNSTNALQEREKFSTFLNQLFNIGKPGLEKIIENDRLRSEVAKNEDLEFLKDQASSRKMYMGKKDDKYEKKVGDKRKREIASAKFAEKKQACQPSTSSKEDTVSEVFGDISDIDTNKNDPDFADCWKDPRCSLKG